MIVPVRRTNQPTSARKLSPRSRPAARSSPEHDQQRRQADRQRIQQGHLLRQEGKRQPEHGQGCRRSASACRRSWSGTACRPGAGCGRWSGPRPGSRDSRSKLLVSSTRPATVLLARLPSPMAMPRSALLIGSTSLTPSPIMATWRPCCSAAARRSAPSARATRGQRSCCARISSSALRRPPPVPPRSPRAPWSAPARPAPRLPGQGGRPWRAPCRGCRPR